MSLKHASKLRMYQWFPCQESRREYQCGMWQKMVHWWKFTRVATWPHLTNGSRSSSKQSSKLVESQWHDGARVPGVLNSFSTWFHVEMWFWRFSFGFVESKPHLFTVTCCSYDPFGDPFSQETHGVLLLFFWSDYGTHHKKWRIFLGVFGRLHDSSCPGGVVVILRQTGAFSTSSRKDRYCLPGRSRNDDIELRSK